MKYFNANILKSVMQKSFLMVLILVAVLSFSAIFYFTGAVKYFSASLSGGLGSTSANTTGYAYGENIGWINFNSTDVNAEVTDSAITGYAYGENIGWISLNGTGYGIANDGEGNLSGYAYGENIGWINFDGVKINPATGVFSGYAYGENIGWISFNGTNYEVTTTWQPPVASTTSDVKTPDQVHGGTGGNTYTLLLNPPVNSTSESQSQSNISDYVSQKLKDIEKSIPRNPSPSQNAIINILTKLLKALKDLLDLEKNK